MRDMVVSENKPSILKLSVPFFYQSFGLGRRVYGKVLRVARGGGGGASALPVSGVKESSR